LSRKSLNVILFRFVPYICQCYNLADIIITAANSVNQIIYKEKKKGQLGAIKLPHESLGKDRLLHGLNNVIFLTNFNMIYN